MLTMYDEFAGFGGSSQGAAAVPGVEVVLAANHLPLAVDVHALNFPAADHYLGDVAKADIARFPRADLFWASPACPKWTNARGVRRDFDRTNQVTLFGPDGPDENTARSRALMEEVPRYLAAKALAGRPVLAGVVENVTECRLWDQWSRWLAEIRTLGYSTRVIALNSMHAAAPRSARAPQSRDRLYLAYWLTALGRSPDWDKWLRPTAWCPTCDRPVAAVQAWKRPGLDMGRYGRHGQYLYRCPAASCRHRAVDPAVAPAAAAIDLSRLGQRIGDRTRPLADATRDRIAAGLARHVRPMLVPAGGTWNRTATAVDEPMRTRTTRDTEALVVPIEARTGVAARPAAGPLRTQTGRAQDALVVPLRANGHARPVAASPLPTFAASGTHHALVMRNNTARGDQGQMCTPVTEPLRTLTTAGHQSLLAWPAHDQPAREDRPAGSDQFVYAYDTGELAPAGAEPLPTQTTVQGDALLTAAAQLEVDDCLFRMLEPDEIAAGMAFAPDYQVRGSKRDRVRGYGNAVTPPAAEVIVSALVEAITGETLEPAR